jgi:hypothetical protein
MDKEAWWQKVADDPHMMWCLKVAGLGVDELVRAGLTPRSEFDRAKKMVAEEIFVRLCLNDLPPPGIPGSYPGTMTRLGESTSASSAKPPRSPR